MLNIRAERAGSPRSAGTSSLRLVTLEDLGVTLGHLDAAAAIGLDPFKSPVRLWMEITGRRDLMHPVPVRDEHQDDSQAYWSRLLEPIVAAHYTMRTGRKVRRIQAMHHHPRHPWMTATVTREVLDSPEVQLLECLCVGLDSAELWIDGVPEHIQLRAQHQLAVTGANAIDVAALLGGQDFRIYRIERDDVRIAWLIDGQCAFWRCVELDQAPPASQGELNLHAP